MMRGLAGISAKCHAPTIKTGSPLVPLAIYINSRRKHIDIIAEKANAASSRIITDIGLLS